MIASLDGSGTALPLQALATAQASVALSEQRLSTGLRVASPRDDGATSAIATRVKAQISAQSVLRENRMRLSSLLDVTMASIDSITDVLTQMKQKALALTDTSLDSTSRAAINTEMQALSDEIDQAVSNAGFNGINLLQDTVTPTHYNLGPATLVHSSSGSFTLPLSDTPGVLDFSIGLQGGTPSAAFQADLGYGPQSTALGASGLQAAVAPMPAGATISYTITAAGAGKFVGLQADYWPNQQSSDFSVAANGAPIAVTHYGMSSTDLGVNPTDNQNQNPPLTPDEVLAQIDSALGRVTADAGYYGTKSNMVDSLVKQGDAQTDVLQASLGQMVDADMAREAATLQAGQSREQLATQALAISNQAPQILLSLFKQ